MADLRERYSPQRLELLEKIAADPKAGQNRIMVIELVSALREALYPPEKDNLMQRIGNHTRAMHEVCGGDKASDCLLCEAARRIRRLLNENDCLNTIISRYTTFDTISPWQHNWALTGEEEL